MNEPKELKSYRLKNENGYEIWKNELDERIPCLGLKEGDYIYEVCDEEDILMSFSTLKEARAWAATLEKGECE